jgi:ankyrin repeat protein
MADPEIQRQFLSALEDGDQVRLEELIALGADVNLPANDPDGQTPLVRAVVAGNADIVRALIQAGANVNIPETRRKCRTPLMFSHGNPTILSELIAAGADVNARSTVHEVVSPIDGTRRRHGRETALHFAAGANHPEAVRLLIQAGAEIEALAEDGLAPLDFALRSGTPTEAAEALVAAGAKTTPERLALMHAAVHRPDSDIRQFPWVNSPDSKHPAAAPPSSETKRNASVEAAASTGPRGEAKCPKCGALLYSRRSRLCGKCGAVLPPELLLTDDQVAAERDEREWARDLANAFGGHPSSADVSARDRPENASVKASLSPEMLLQRASFAEEFRRRDRPAFWLYVLGYSFIALTFVAISRITGAMPLSAGLIFAGFLVCSCFMSWRRASPICPNCKQNIRVCATSYCHRCGNPLQAKRCAECSVDYSWTGWLSAYTNRGNSCWIRYCPGCGVELDSWITRWRLGRR